MHWCLNVMLSVEEHTRSMLEHAAQLSLVQTTARAAAHSRSSPRLSRTCSCTWQPTRTVVFCHFLVLQGRGQRLGTLRGGIVFG